MATTMSGDGALPRDQLGLLRDADVAGRHTEAGRGPLADAVRAVGRRAKTAEALVAAGLLVRVGAQGSDWYRITEKGRAWLRDHAPAKAPAGRARPDDTGGGDEGAA